MCEIKIKNDNQLLQSLVSREQGSHNNCITTHCIEL